MNLDYLMSMNMFIILKKMEEEQLRKRYWIKKVVIHQCFSIMFVNLLFVDADFPFWLCTRCLLVAGSDSVCIVCLIFVSMALANLSNASNKTVLILLVLSFG